MQVARIEDRDLLANFLGRQRALNAYLIGDLDDAQWGQTEYWAISDGEEIQEVALLYHGMTPPILITVQNSAGDWMRQLLEKLIAELPNQIYAHLSAGLLDIVETRFQVEDHGPHNIMDLTSDDVVRNIDATVVELLQPRDYDALEALYAASYPGHWFRRNMLEKGPYVGIRDSSGEIFSAGGAHVYSRRYGVATLGNIVTLPERRGEGLGRLVSAKLCQILSGEVDTIGLNVHAQNKAAIHIYESLNFRKLAEYSEMTLREF